MTPSVDLKKDSASNPARQAIGETGTHREAGPKASHWSWHLRDATEQLGMALIPKELADGHPMQSQEGPIGIDPSTFDVQQ